MAGYETSSVYTPAILLFTLCVGLTLLALLWIWGRISNSSSEETLETGPSKEEKVKESESTATQGNKSKKKGPEKRVKTAPNKLPTHPHQYAVLKGHSASVRSFDISANGKYIITAAEDRSVLIWNTKDLSQKDHRSVRGNIEYDYATHVCWSPDSKAFIVFKATANVIEVYKVGKKSDGSLGNIQLALTFPQHDATEEVLSMGFAVTGKYIMTCSSTNQLVIWDLRGEILETIDVRHGDTYSATISPCGRFVATTGFTPDVKVWEVRFNKTGSFEGIKRAYQLKGHKSGIYSCHFNSDSTKMVSVSKDGTWRLYDTNIEFDKGQEPYLILTGQHEPKDQRGLIQLSPDGRTIALGAGSSLSFFSAITGECLNQITDIYSGDIVGLMFDPSSKLIMTLGDKHAKVFHNVAGYMATLQDLEQSRTKATSAGMRERIDVQIVQAKSALADINKITQG
ncbi:transducin beta-like protein 2 isoform X2 [Oratosquilla oratoria]|uniref:transducin beta-like protein 2 isoform X2 n=1 Tax=Oratosquilla oratoria TaxID=337810 RepID=UPI003F761C44